jgi:hypothetical protein
MLMITNLTNLLISAKLGKINHGVNNFYQRENKIFLRELDAVSKFPNLSWRWYNDIPILKGIYQFKIDYRGHNFKDNFNLEFIFPSDYPESFPIVKELDMKIPDTFHRFTNGYLCLCTPSEQWMIFSKKPTLENYIENLVNPYLLSWLWYEKFNEMPWGERQHGPMGLVESYQELLKIDSFQQTKIFLNRFLMNQIDKKDECPCGSGQIIKKCHKTKVTKLTNRLPKKRLLDDFLIIMEG